MYAIFRMPGCMLKGVSSHFSSSVSRHRSFIELQCDCMCRCVSALLTLLCCYFFEQSIFPQWEPMLHNWWVYDKFFEQIKSNPKAACMISPIFEFPNIWSSVPIFLGGIFLSKMCFFVFPVSFFPFFCIPQILMNPFLLLFPYFPWLFFGFFWVFNSGNKFFIHHHTIICYQKNPK